MFTSLHHLRRPLSASLHCLRRFSSSANPYPFPTNANPTPHQIFHLPPSATRDQVKARYYDLVRIYHPDSPVSRALPPEKAHTRFQAIGEAYAVLIGKKPASASGEAGAGSASSTLHDISRAMWRERQRRKAELDIGFDDRWKERLMALAVILTLGTFVWQTWSARRQALEQAGRIYQYPAPGRRTTPDLLSASDEARLAAPDAEASESKS
ncbi:hypothetical protein OBBRIDRAFT_779137 [Obba rivulosa]|uniref:J domain-containing protein n=1 Tax=Obba rivulosa TaxID=1052685 RepID=A0A8E2ATK7_9APHY|nr:hypothetical protein OBBRIDRAFT_779137 [Obba rivulosa]